MDVTSVLIPVEVNIQKHHYFVDIGNLTLKWFLTVIWFYQGFWLIHNELFQVEQCHHTIYHWKQRGAKNMKGAQWD